MGGRLEYAERKIRREFEWRKIIYNLMMNKKMQNMRPAGSGNAETGQGRFLYEIVLKVREKREFNQKSRP